MSITTTPPDITRIAVEKKLHQALYGDLPQLSIDLRRKKNSIAITWTVLFMVTCVQAEFFYFVLRYGAKVDPNTALTVPTAILGIFSVITIGFRAFQLFRKGSQCGPIDVARWGGDYFMWNIIVGFILVTVVLVTATSPHPPNIRQASMPQAIVLFLAGIQAVITGFMSATGIRTPVRLSSTSPGSIAIPCILVLVEDVMAVDGAAGREFRKALHARYEACASFRRLIAQLNWFWGVGSLSTVAGVTIIVYVVSDPKIGFALGWCLPWLWAATATAVTIKWSQRALRREYAEWETPNAKVSP